MNVTLNSPLFKEVIVAPPSKSEAHRALICASLARAATFIPCAVTNNDIEATAGCLRALGANIEKRSDGYYVEPIKEIPQFTECDCGESGTTLRFMIPLCAAFGCKTTLTLHGRLPERPLSPLDTVLAGKGVSVTKHANTVTVSGSLPKNDDWSIAGNVSSQFISGMLFALTVVGGTLTVTEKTESRPYIEMTCGIINGCGGSITEINGKYTVSSAYPLNCQESVYVGGDWSGAAFPLVIGAVGKRSVTVKGLDISSAQGDKAIIAVLKKMGAEIEQNGTAFTAHPSKLYGCTVDCADIPDLVPVLAVAALRADVKTEFINAARLRLKESDRISATAAMIRALGGKVEEKPDGLTVYKSYLTGGKVNSENDHRIAMSAAAAACFASGKVEITDAQCVNKSYPAFWEEFEALI